MPPKRKYRAKKGDSFATFPNPQEVMNLNPGVANLSTGQEIWVPGMPSSPNPNTTFAPTFTPAVTQPPNFTSANSFMSGNTLNFSGTPPMSAGLYGTNAPIAPPVTPPSSIKIARPGAVPNPQAQAAANQNNVAVTANPALPANYVYTGGNDPLSIEQRRQWNIAAGGTGNERVFLMTREQKNAASMARRRARGRTGGQITLPADAVPAAQGNAVNSALSWRVG